MELRIRHQTEHGLGLFKVSPRLIDSRLYSDYRQNNPYSQAEAGYGNNGGYGGNNQGGYDGGYGGAAGGGAGGYDNGGGYPQGGAHEGGNSVFINLLHLLLAVHFMGQPSLTLFLQRTMR